MRSDLALVRCAPTIGPVVIVGTSSAESPFEGGFGETYPYRGRHRSTTVRAVTHTDTYKLYRGDFMDLARNFKPASLAIVDKVAHLYAPIVGTAIRKTVYGWLHLPVVERQQISKWKKLKVPACEPVSATVPSSSQYLTGAAALPNSLVATVPGPLTAARAHRSLLVAHPLG